MEGMEKGVQIHAEFKLVVVFLFVLFYLFFAVMCPVFFIVFENSYFLVFFFTSSFS